MNDKLSSSFLKLEDTEFGLEVCIKFHTVEKNITTMKAMFAHMNVAHWCSSHIPLLRYKCIITKVIFIFSKKKCSSSNMGFDKWMEEGSAAGHSLTHAQSP